jgi:uncharacterized protein
VLSLDGGGARGYLSIRILANIEKYLDLATGTKVPLGHRFDLIAGTSTGGIIAIGLASGKTAEEIMKFYEDLIPKVFSSSARRNPLSRLYRPKYESDPLRKALEELFKGATLENVQTDICITAVALRSGKPRFYKSDYKKRNFARIGEKLTDIALATSAAPTYFESHNLKYSDHLIDGGICANNPSVVALVEAVNFERPSKRGTVEAKGFTDVVMISVGTGDQPAMPYNADSIANAGLIEWAKYISDVMFESQSWVAHSQASFLLGQNYLRINPQLKLAMTLDDISYLNELKNISDIGEIEAGIPQMNPKPGWIFALLPRFDKTAWRRGRRP